MPDMYQRGGPIFAGRALAITPAKTIKLGKSLVPIS